MNYLEITTKDTRYVYSTGRIRGLEKYLIKDADLTRIKEAKDLEDSIQSLSHIYPYSESLKVYTDPTDFERGLEEEWRRTYVEIKSFAPEPELVDLFWLEQDFHNMKILFKLYAQGKLPQEVEKVENLSTSGTLSLGILSSAIAKGDLFSLPSFLKDKFKEIIQRIERGVSPLDIDLFFDKVYLQRFSSEIKKYTDNFLEKIANILIDSLNIKNFLRIKLWKKENEERLFDEVIVEGGEVGKNTIMKVVGEPLDSLQEVVKGTRYSEACQRALEEWEKKHSLFTLDRSLEEIILAFTHRGFYVTFGREPLINYIFLKKAEIKNLRGILRAKKANLSPPEI